MTTPITTSTTDKGPYKFTTAIIPAVPRTDDSLASEKEEIHLLLTRIGDEIYIIVDAYKIAHDMWIAIERLQQGESLNIQDVKTNLIWKFGRFTSHDGETIESYYSRFYKMMNEMQNHDLDIVSYHKLFDVLKQYQKEVNEMRSERIAKNANPLALVVAAQQYPDPYYQIAKPITPPSESASEEDSDSKQAQRDKDMHKNLALIAKYFKKIYKPTNNNLRTSSNSRNKNVDTSLRKPKRVKDYTYHKEKMLLCKQGEKGVPLQAEQANWLEDTYEEIDEQELEAHYSYMEKIQEDDSNVIPDSSDMCDNDIQNDQNAEECDDERDALANLIANLTLDTEENKKILKQLKKANTSLNQELKECKSNHEESNTTRDRLLAQKEIDIKEGLKLKAYEISLVKEKHKKLVKQSFLTKSRYKGLVKEKTKVITDLKLKEEKDLDKLIAMEKQLKFLNEIVYKRNQSIQTIHMLAPKGSTFNGRPNFANPLYLKKAQSEKPCLYEILYDTSDLANVFSPDKEETLTLEKEKLVDQAWEKLTHERFRAPTALDMKVLTLNYNAYIFIKSKNVNVLHKNFLNKLKLCPKHMIGNLKLLCNIVEKYLGTVYFGNDQFASILGYGDLVQGNIMIKRVYYVKGINHNLFSVGEFCDADLEVAFWKSTYFVRDLQGNDLLSGNRGSDLYIISLQETTSSTPIYFMAKASPTQAWLWHRRLSHLKFDYINLLLKKDIVIGLPKFKYVKDQLCSSCERSKAKRSLFKIKVIPSSKRGLNLLHMDLCGPMCVESINGKKYILVIVDDYSRYTWTLFLRSKDETPEFLKDFLKMIQCNLQAQVITVQTDRGTEFLNKTLHAYFKEDGIEHQTSTS
ncbi:retrovirus-related pol polyprotein from transposon TNT 1-94 [Tanacetum coccineum]